jgi:hypothetical protein
MQLEKKEIFCIIKQIVINICSFADVRKTCLKKITAFARIAKVILLRRL